jgi:hypothetical protein
VQQDAAAGLAPGQDAAEEPKPEEVAWSLDAPAATTVEAVGTSDPTGDFLGLIRAGKLDAAFSSMQAAVTALVDNSMGSRYGSPARL